MHTKLSELKESGTDFHVEETMAAYFKKEFPLFITTELEQETTDHMEHVIKKHEAPRFIEQVRPQSC